MLIIPPKQMFSTHDALVTKAENTMEEMAVDWFQAINLVVNNRKS